MGQPPVAPPIPPLELTDVFLRLAVAAGLGLLVGLQREWSEKAIAGIRTFPLISLLGGLCALLGQELGGWVLPLGFASLAAVVVGAQALDTRQHIERSSITTEVACLVLFAVGAAAMAGFLEPAIVVAGTTAVLLHWKKPLHEFVGRLGESDSRAIFRLALLSLVILPVLPDRSFDPYQVLNPRQIWLMVVLILGISLLAYVAFRLTGSRGGTVLSGLLGGLISSTAAAVSYARGARGGSLSLASAVVLSLLSSSTVFLRVLLEIGLVVPGRLTAMAPPILVLTGLMALLSAVSFLVCRGSLRASVEQGAPSDLKGALLFGLLYAVVLLLVALANEHAGEHGLYAVAAVSGLTDMDAITLSTAQLVKSGQLPAASGWRLIVVGAMANLVFKAAVVMALGGARLFTAIAVLYGVALAGGGLLLWLWP